MFIDVQEHPDLSKTDKKQLCRVLDCQKLSPEICAHAVRNERLPLRTVVQILFFEHEKANSSTSRKQTSSEQPWSRSDDRGRGNRSCAPSTSGVHDHDDKLQLRSEPSFKVRQVTEVETTKGRDAASGAQLSSGERALIRRISHKSQS